MKRNRDSLFSSKERGKENSFFRPNIIVFFALAGSPVHLMQAPLVPGEFSYLRL